jgi:VWFA-related protein
LTHRTRVLAAIRWIPLFSFCLTLLAAPQPPNQERETNSLPQATLQVSTVVVNVYAIVKDKQGHLIPNLNEEDFELTEDHVPQQIAYFSHETDSPLSLGIMIDTSASQEQLLATEQKHARAFIQHVLRPKDLAFVLRFDVEVELLQDFTSEQRLLGRAIDNTVINEGGYRLLPDPSAPAPVGGTHLYDALYLASNELMKSNVGRKVVIMLTDGEDQGSKVTPNSALEAAEKADVIIYSVALTDESFYWAQGLAFRGNSVLKKFSEETGGQTVAVNRARDIGAAFQEIADELRAQYFLGYSPSNRLRDGSFRKIRVRIRNRNYRVRVRGGYYAQAE